MLSYHEILNQAQNLSRDEQEQLLQDLKQLITQTPTSQDAQLKHDLKRWRGFLSKRVEPLEFQVKIRQEWDG